MKQAAYENTHLSVLDLQKCKISLWLDLSAEFYWPYRLAIFFSSVTKVNVQNVPSTEQQEQQQI